MSTTETETKQIKGVCQEVSERGDWTTFHIDTGGQWPVKLSTKLPELIEQGRAAKNSDAVWTFKESQGGANPHKPGTFYTNRYLSKVEVGGAVEIRGDDGRIRTENIGDPSTASSNDEGMTPAKWDAKERRDYRSRAWAQTLAAFQHTIKVDEKPENVFRRLQPFQRKVYEDVCGTFAYPEDDSDLPFQ